MKFPHAANPVRNAPLIISAWLGLIICIKYALPMIKLTRRNERLYPIFSARKPIGMDAIAAAKGVKLRTMPRKAGVMSIERIYKLKTARNAPKPRLLIKTVAK